MNLRLDEMTPGMPVCQRVYCAARARRYECKTKVPQLDQMKYSIVINNY